jgi:hypothetical protein
MCVFSTEDIDVFFMFLRTGADTDFIGPEAYTILGALFKKNNTKLYVKVNICIGPIPENEELLFFK